MTRNLLISIFFGALIGLSTACYSLGLEEIAAFHSSNLMYPFFLILVFVFIIFYKRNTLYFPTTVQEVVEAVEVEQKHWSSLSCISNLLGSWMSHFAGASLGREGTVIVMASSLAQALKLNWNYYKPIVIAAAFACVTGQPLVAVVIISELFTTNINQKIFSFVMAWVGVLVLKTLHVPLLLAPIVVDLDIGFFNKISVAVLIGLFAGLLTYLYKKSHLYLSQYFKKNLLISVLVVALLTWIFVQPMMKPLHSLSLDTFFEIQNGRAQIDFLILKIVFTLLFVSLGFIGGDFVPLIVVGAGFGVLTAQMVGVSYQFGLALGFMSFFTGATRLKWTSLALVYLLTGFSVMLWAYLCLSMVRHLSGPVSLYRKSKSPI